MGYRFPVAGDDDLRVSIDWGDDDPFAPRGRRPLDWAELGREAAIDDDFAAADDPAPGETAGQRDVAPAPLPPEPSRSDDLFRPTLGSDTPTGFADTTPAEADSALVDLSPASFEGLDAGIANANRRIESLFTEAEKLRELTSDRLSQFAAEVSAMSTVADELRSTVNRESTTLRGLTGTFGQLPADLARLVAAVTAMEAHLDEVVAAQRDLADRFSSALDAAASRLESRIQRTTADAVSRLRGSLDELEVNVRDSAGAAQLAELSEHVAEVAEEIRQVKRRLVLRAKAPPAVLADEQVEIIVKRVTAAVRASAAGPAPAAEAPARPPRRAAAPATDEPAPRKPVARRRRVATDDD